MGSIMSYKNTVTRIDDKKKWNYSRWRFSPMTEMEVRYEIFCHTKEWYVKLLNGHTKDGHFRTDERIGLGCWTKGDNKKYRMIWKGNENCPENLEHRESNDPAEMVCWMYRKHIAKLEFENSSKGIDLTRQMEELEKKLKKSQEATRKIEGEMNMIHKARRDAV